VLTSRPATVLFAVVLFAACSHDKARSKLTSESAAGTSIDTSANADENHIGPEAAAAQSLLQQLADRDEAMLEMARLAMTRREQLKVSATARRILSEQRKESNHLLGTLKGEYQLTYKPRIPPADQPHLDSLNGAGVGDFDRLFLGVVAKHYEDDAQIIERALPHVTPKLREMLTTIREQRLSELAALKK
jgi:uncharacterized protein (DUF305 family)